MTEEWEKKKKDVIAGRTQPAITRTCKEIRVDALKLYYTCNSFKASYCYDREELHTTIWWLRCIGAQNRGLLGSLEVFDQVAKADDDMCMEEPRKHVGARWRLGALGATVVWKECGVFAVTFPKVKLEK